MTTTPMSGRKAQAARNDELILTAAREVFTADPGAPIAAVAERAGVGISALYRRYASKDALLQKLCGDGLKRYIACAEKALADHGDPWESFATFMRDLVDADTSSLTIALAGTFTPTAELYGDARRAEELGTRVHERTIEAGVLRADVTAADISLIFEELASIKLGDHERTMQIRHRHLAMILDGLRLPPNTSPLPGPAPDAGELAARWTP
ncbi:TetR/AcrR family transcriptional regulator [Nonomuraea sp. NPDC050536]|uniref:TetR/AcrR family transcriptional regulator n=1 Tax=Nonomuraea sp. NPDC050536 TaxID=3364366 RepID=UPI0037C93DF1